MARARAPVNRSPTLRSSGDRSSSNRARSLARRSSDSLRRDHSAATLAGRRRQAASTGGARSTPRAQAGTGHIISSAVVLPSPGSAVCGPAQGPQQAELVGSSFSRRSGNPSRAAAAERPSPSSGRRRRYTGPCSAAPAFGVGRTFFSAPSADGHRRAPALQARPGSPDPLRASAPALFVRLAVNHGHRRMPSVALLDLNSRTAPLSMRI